MAIQYINTGSSANAGNGDSLRSAFVKVNNNFAYLSTASGGAGNGYTGSQGIVGYTGSAGNQGNIGYTGSAGISNVNIEIQPESEVNALAFYLTTSTISRVPRIKANGGVLFIGDKNSPGFLSGLYIENNLSAEGFGRGFTYANHLGVAESNNFTFYRSRGTSLAPTATQSGDEIVDINFLGHNGTTATYGFNITASIDQVPVGGQQPMRLTFAGNNNAGQVLSHMIITSTGTVRMYKLGAIGSTTTSISVSTSLVPATDVTHDLGSADRQWRSLYVSSSTVYINRTPLTIDDQGTLLVNGSSVLGTPGYSGSRGNLGYTGSRGDAGSTGTQGSIGFTGSQGLRGYNGSRGDTGYVGSQGDIGYVGSQGDLGYVGSRGDTGYVGSQGDIGYVGSEGTPGQQGNRGYTGSEGLQGTPGLQGQTGAQGINIVLVGSTTTVTTSTVGLGTAGQGWINTTDGDVYFWNTGTQLWENIGPIVGPQGDLGYTGSKGDQGNIGLTGDPGFTGSQGANGYDGSQGEIGYVGSQGELGYTGSQGDLGYVGSQGDIGYSGSQGELGYTGSQGDLGYVGSQGDIGYSGSQGELGYTGSQGDVGYVGSTGSRGFQGYTGSQGEAGYSGSLGYTGSAGAGYTGSQGEAGYSGSLGNTGYTGSQGERGEAGGNANTANFVFTASQISVSNNSDITVVTNANTWTFNNSGALTFPQGTTIATADGTDAFLIDGAVDKDVQIYTYSGETAHGWTFGADGTLTLPSGNTRIGNILGTDGIVGSTGTSVAVSSQGQGGYAGIQWIDDPEDATFIAAIVVNSPIAATSGTVQIVTGIVAGPTAENVWEFGTDGNLTVPDDIQDINGSVIRIATTSTAPTRVDGQLWYNSIDGRTYIKYNGQWVDASPVVVPQPSTYLDEITIDGSTININDNTLTISNTGTLLINGAEVTGSAALGDRLVNGVYEVVLDASGNLTADGDIKTGVNGGRFVQDCNDGTTSIRWTRIPEDQTVELIRAYTGDTETPDDVERAQISVEWQDSARTGVSITAFDDGDENKWEFKGDGTFTLPNNSTISDGMEAIRLEPAGASSSTQALLIYPTVQDGNHIHLTSGGGDTDLYLGNDDQFVKVDHSGTVVVGTYSTATTSTWTFGTDGVLTLSTASTILGNNSDPNVYIETASTSTAINTWTFAADGGLTLPNGATIVDTTSTLVLTPNSPGQATSLVLRSTYNSYMTADYPTDQGYQQYLHELDPVTYPDPYVSTGTEGTVISITLWDSNGSQYLQGDVEYIITGTGITAADFTPAVLTGTFAAANWTLDGGGFNYTNTNMLMIADDAIVEGEETFTVTIVTTGTYAPGSGSNYLNVNIADGTTEGSESGHIHLISENMAQTSIFLGNDDKYVKVAADDQIYINVPNVNTSATSQLWTFAADGSLTLPAGGDIKNSSGTSVLTVVTGQETYEFDGVNTTLTITNVTFNLLFCTMAGGYSGSDGHTVLLPPGTAGQRLVIVSISSLCTLTVDGAIDGAVTVAPEGTAELIYLVGAGVTSWWPLYGTTLVT